jgi:hypothetical protein
VGYVGQRRRRRVDATIFGFEQPEPSSFGRSP